MALVNDISNAGDDGTVGSRYGFALIAILFLLPAVPLAFLGYGSDNDTYGVLDAGVETWIEGSPSMSRHPGYWLYEAVVFALDRLGGALLINVCTIAVSLLILQRLWAACTALGLRWRVPIVLALAWNPWFLIASASTIDYQWSLLFVVLSIDALVARKPLLAGVLGGIAAAFRLGAIFTLGAAVGLWFLRGPSWPRLRAAVVTLAAIVLLALVALVPSWLVTGRNFAFLAPHLGDAALWTPKMYVGRIVYKPIYLFGLLATLVLLALLAFNGRAVLALLRDRRDLVSAAAGAVAGTGLLFVRYPIEHSYLLPAMPFLLLLLGVVLGRAPAWQPWLFVATIASFWIVSFPLATPDKAREATDARIGLRVEAGALLADVRARLRLRGCHTLACYDQREGVVTGRKRY